MAEPRTLIILAHPDPASFTGAWADASLSVAAALGPARLIDLYGTGFDPAERLERYGPEARDVMSAQDAAAKAGRLPEQVAEHIAAVMWADRVVLHFPLWWFAPPAMLKGWCDRVLVHGALHDSARRFDAGICRGKRVLFCVTTGASAAESGPGGKEGDTRLLLWPLAYTLRYCGFDICRPELEHGVHGFHRGAAQTDLQSRLARRLADQHGLIATLADRPLWRFNPDTAFDDTGRLGTGEDVLWPFIDPDGALPGA